jgi:hypothetical protein
MDAFQVAFLGGFPGDPFGDEFFSHYFSMGTALFHSASPLVKIVVPNIFLFYHKHRNLAGYRPQKNRQQLCNRSFFSAVFALSILMILWKGEKIQAIKTR